jgi:inner membrane protein
MIQVGVDHVFLNPIPYLLGSIFPDCDHKRAPMGKIFPVWLFCKHRTITHSMYGLLAFSSLVSLYNVKWGILFASGYLLHLLEDSSTPMGINWWMVKKKARS